MRLRVDFGCHRDREMKRAGGPYASSTVRVIDTYAVSPFNLDLPDEGTANLEVDCPTCGEPLSLTLTSMERLQLLFLTAFFFIGAVLFGLGALLWAGPAAGNQTFRVVAWVAFGLGSAAVAGAVALAFTKPDFLATTGSAVQVARGGLRHKILKAQIVRR